MIIYRMTPLPVHLKNIMVLDDNNGEGILYVSASTYKQATLLHSRFGGDVDRLMNNISNPVTREYINVPGLKDAIGRVQELLPVPMNMLAAYLMYCAANKGIDWENADNEFLIGVLHQFSQIVDFNAIALQPASVQAEISVPTVFLKQYLESWEMLTASLDEYIIPQTVVQPVVVEQQVVVKETVAPSPAPAVPVAPVTTDAVQEAEEDEEDEEEDPAEAARIAALLAELDEFNKKTDDNLNKLDKQSKGIEEKISGDKPKNSDEDSTGNTSLMTDENAEYVKEANAVLDEFDI